MGNTNTKSDNTTLLYQRLSATIHKAEKGRKFVNIFKIIIFGGALVFFLFMWINMFLAYNEDNFSSDTVMKLVFPLFAVIIVGNFIFAKAYAYFTTQEKTIIKEILQSLFPKVKYHEYLHNVTEGVLKSSHLFSGMRKVEVGIPAQTFASMELDVENIKLNIADIGICSSKVNNTIAGSSLSFGIMAFYKGLIKPLFSSRIESSMYDFRGMFGWAKHDKEFKTSMLILPDHLEDKLGYLAQNIQALKKVEGNSLVKLEDTEFEHNFAVYAKDEVGARYILTPGMMQRMNELKRKFNRNIMFSFYKDTFYVAVYMPDGFLSLKGSSLKNKNIIDEIYNDIHTSCEVLKELHLN